MKRDILIIGSNHQSAVYSGLLAGYGYHIAEARTAGDGYSLLAGGLKPSTVILDLKFADLRDIIPALRAVGGDNVNIIVVGGDNTVDALAMKRGAHVFLHKPVPAETMIHAVQTSIAS
jgi:DNA-binding NtrC family response regulator